MTFDSQGRIEPVRIIFEGVGAQPLDEHEEPQRNPWGPDKDQPQGVTVNPPCKVAVASAPTHTSKAAASCTQPRVALLQ